MSLTPRQLRQLLDDVNRIYNVPFLSVYNGDTGGWICADSGILAPASLEAARLKPYADAHGNAHARDGRMRDIWMRLRAMGQTPSSTVDTGVA